MALLSEVYQGCNGSGGSRSVRGGSIATGIWAAARCRLPPYGTGARPLSSQGPGGPPRKASVPLLSSGSPAPQQKMRTQCLLHQQRSQRLFGAGQTGQRRHTSECCCQRGAGWRCRAAAAPSLQPWPIHAPPRKLGLPFCSPLASLSLPRCPHRWLLRRPRRGQPAPCARPAARPTPPAPAAAGPGNQSTAPTMTTFDDRERANRRQTIACCPPGVLLRIRTGLPRFIVLWGAVCGNMWKGGSGLALAASEEWVWLGRGGGDLRRGCWGNNQTCCC